MRNAIAFGLLMLAIAGAEIVGAIAIIASGIRQMTQRRHSGWRQARHSEPGCPLCGTLLGEQDGADWPPTPDWFCPACCWTGKKQELSV